MVLRPGAAGVMSRISTLMIQAGGAAVFAATGWLWAAAGFAAEPARPDVRALERLVVQVRTLGERPGICSGVLLDRRRVLTAAHCVQGLAPEQVLIRFFSGQAPSGSLKIVRPPETPQRGAPDMALLVLKPPANADPPHLAPMAWLDPAAIPADGLVAVSAGAPSFQPHAIALPPGRLVSWTSGTAVLVFDTSAACPGDSGGPVIASTASGPALVGVIVDGSAQASCAWRWLPKPFAKSAFSIVQLRLGVFP